MKKNLIYSLFITSLVISNVVTGKILDLYGLIVPGAFLLYAVTFLMTDVVSELWGKEEANRLVLIGFICSLFSAGMIFLTQHLPVAVFAIEKQKAYELLLGMNLRIVLASMTAYYISQRWDIWMFHLLKKKTNGKHKWLRNNVSTMTSQLIDTVIFITIAFWGIVPNLFWMVVSQYIVKLIVAGVDTPMFYLLTRGSVKSKLGVSS